MHHFCSLDFRVPTRCPGECLWRDPPRPVLRARRHVLCLEFSVGSGQRAQHEGLSANLITTVFGIEKATMLLIQIRSVFEGPQVRNDAQEGDVSIKITKKQCECRRARLIFAGLRTHVCPRAVILLGPCPFTKPGCVLGAQSCRGARIDEGPRVAQNVTVELRRRVPITMTVSRWPPVGLTEVRGHRSQCGGCRQFPEERS